MPPLLFFSLALGVPTGMPAVAAASMHAAYVDSTPAGPPRTRPLTMDFVGKLGTLKKKIRAAQLDSIAQARGVVGPPIDMSIGAPYSVVVRKRDSIVVRSVQVLGIPEARVVFDSSTMTPEEYTWGNVRVHFAWLTVKLKQEAALRGFTLGATGLNLPASNADVTFVEAHEADIRKTDFPEPELGLLTLLMMPDAEDVAKLHSLDDPAPGEEPPLPSRPRSRRH